MASKRVVLDTNVFISGLFSTSSKPALAVEQAITRDQALATTGTLKELLSNLLSPKFDPYIPRRKREELVLRLSPLVEIVEVVRVVRACRDPRDDKFLEAAINGRGDLIVTGDKDLLVLNPYAGVAIVTPSAYIAEGHEPQPG